MNPYLIPEMETPGEPLCPYKHDHEKYYVPVDNTQQEFEKFQQSIMPHGGFRNKGRLIVVTGKDGCGKTSLINRCAAWLQGKLAGEDNQGPGAQIFPLTGSTVKNVPVKVRMGQVLDALIDELSTEGSDVNAAQVARVEARRNELKSADSDEEHYAGIERVYNYLHRALPPRRVAVILLPQSDLGQESEIEKYAALARFPQVVFFAESSYSESVQRSMATVRTGDNPAPILLEVGPLNRDDGWRYAAARQMRETVASDTPVVTEETMRKVVGNKKLSIRGLEGLLYGVYKELSDDPVVADSLVSREVSFEHFTKYYFRFFGQPGGAS